MKLAARLVVVMLLATGVLLAVDGYFLIRRSREDFEEGMRFDVGFFGNALARTVGDTWREKGRDHALRLLEELDRLEGPARVRWVWLDGAPDDPDAPRAARPEIVEKNPAAHPEERREEGEWRYFYVPVRTGEARPGALEFAAPLSPLADFSRDTALRVALLSGALVLFGGGVIVLLGFRLIGKPLAMLLEKVRRVGEGDLSGDLHLRGSHELGELAGAVNGMCAALGEARERVAAEMEARIQAVEQLRHADRLKTVGRFASGMAHELGTPLNIVSARAGMIAAGNLPDEEVGRNATIIRSQVDRMTTLVRQLLDFARPSPPKRVSTDLRDLARETTALVGNLKHPGKVEAPEEGEPVTARIDPGQMQQVLANLIVNGLQAMPDGGTVRIGLRRDRVDPPPDVGGAEAEFVLLTVTDEGTGIDPEQIPHLFEPFFTTKEVGEGTGLGLSIAHGIVREHGGWIAVASEPGEGSTFTVHLPREEAPCTDA